MESLPPVNLLQLCIHYSRDAEVNLAVLESPFNLGIQVRYRYQLIASRFVSHIQMHTVHVSALIHVNIHTSGTSPFYSHKEIFYILHSLLSISSNLSFNIILNTGCFKNYLRVQF